MQSAYKKSPPTEKETFTKTPKKTTMAEPKRKTKKEEKSEGVFTETEGKIKDGGLRKALKVDKDYKFSSSSLKPLLKHEEGKKFTFQDNQFFMSEKLKKQIQLAVNMMKK